MVYKIDDMRELYNAIAYVGACSPDKFPYRDFLPPEEQSTFENQFQRLRDAIAIIDPKIATPEMLPRLHSLLEESYEAYKSGDSHNGFELLEDWSELIFGPEP